MRRFLATALVVLLAASGVVSAAGPAAAITWLPVICSGFKACNEAGRGNAGYEKVWASPHWNMYGGHNCTNYVAFRLQSRIPNFITPGQGDAYQWGAQARSAGLVVDKTAEVGSIAWWDQDSGINTSRLGHVAYVESVNSKSGTIVVSEDSFGGDFGWRTYKISEVSGFIHIPSPAATTSVVSLDADGDGVPDITELAAETDVNGDGRLDVVGFASGGVYVAANTGGKFTAAVRWIANFGSGDTAGGWRVGKHPRTVLDVTGDGFPDVVGFANKGVYVAVNTGSKFSAPKLWLADFGYKAGGWRVEKHPRTVVDVTGDGLPDVVGFGNKGVYVAVNTGSKFSAPKLWLADFGYKAGGWRVEKHPRTVVDVTGDGRPDVVGFGDKGVYVAVNTGSRFLATELWVGDFGYKAGGWRIDKHPRTVVDVTGDGLPDVVGFGSAGVYVAVNKGSAFESASLWIKGFGYSDAGGGWRVLKHPRTLVDVTGDGLPDIVGFGNAGVYVAVNTGTKFGSPSLWSDTFGYNSAAGGWRVDKHPRMVVDVTGDGRPDLLGFANNGVYVQANSGAAFVSGSTWLKSYGYKAGGWRVGLHPRLVASN